MSNNEIIQVLKETTGKFFFNLSVGKGFVWMIQNPKAIAEML